MRTFGDVVPRSSARAGLNGKSLKFAPSAPAGAVVSEAAVIWRDGVRNGTRDALTGVIGSAAGVLLSISSSCTLSALVSVGVLASVKRSRWGSQIRRRWSRKRSYVYQNVLVQSNSSDAANYQSE